MKSLIGDFLMDGTAVKMDMAITSYFLIFSGKMPPKWLIFPWLCDLHRVPMFPYVEFGLCFLDVPGCHCMPRSPL